MQRIIDTTASEKLDSVKKIAEQTRQNCVCVCVCVCALFAVSISFPFRK